VTPSDIHKLILSNSKTSPTEYELTKSETIIGRDPDVDITISSPAVSRRHARLTRDGDAYMIEDLGSSNGTFINGQRVNEKRLLASGDQIRLGQAIALDYSAPQRDAQATVVSQPPDPAAGVLETQLEQSIDFENLKAAPPKLLVTVAGESSQTYSLTRPVITIGRGQDNDIVIPSPIVSSQHARLDRMNGGYVLEMLPQAKNPVLVEGRPLDGSHVLHHGDLLRIGSLDPGVMVTISYQSPSARKISSLPTRI